MKIMTYISRYKINFCDKQPSYRKVALWPSRIQEGDETATCRPGPRPGEPMHGGGWAAGSQYGAGNASFKVVHKALPAKGFNCHQR
jgi:hypothetical protein